MIYPILSPGKYPLVTGGANMHLMLGEGLNWTLWTNKDRLLTKSNIKQ